MNTMSIDEIRSHLSQRRKNMILTGCMLMLCGMAALGLSLSTLQNDMLKAMNAQEMFSLVTVLAALATCLMTPVGGRLADMIGTKNVFLAGGLMTVLGTLVLPLLPWFGVFMVVRFVISAGTGLFVSAPFTLVREIFDGKQVPSKMGLLTAALGVGSLLGGFLAGVFADHSMMYLAETFPVIFFLIGVPLIYFNVPQRHLVHEPFDLIGLLLLAAGLSMEFLALNEGSRMGWGSIWIIGGLIGGLLVLAGFCFYEKKSSYPLIPMRLFGNKEFDVLLLIGFLTFFYLNAMNVYVPMGVQQVIKASTTASGSLQIPRTIITLFLPALLGLWIVKKRSRTVAALAMAGLFILIPFAGLTFIGPSMPVWFVMAMIALTGISESFRSVSITPAAQALLEPRDLGIGTSLLAFINALSGAIASSVYGIAYDVLRTANEGIHGVTMGLDTVFLLSAAIGLICVLLVLFVFRPLYNARHKTN